MEKHEIFDDLDLSKNTNECLQELEIEFPPDLIVHPMGSVLDLHLVQDEPKVLFPKKFDGKTVTIAMVDPDAPRGTNPTARYCLRSSSTFYSQSVLVSKVVSDMAPIFFFSENTFTG